MFSSTARSGGPLPVSEIPTMTKEALLNCFNFEKPVLQWIALIDTIEDLLEDKPLEEGRITNQSNIKILNSIYIPDIKRLHPNDFKHFKGRYPLNTSIAATVAFARKAMQSSKNYREKLGLPTKNKKRKRTSNEDASFRPVLAAPVTLQPPSMAYKGIKNVIVTDNHACSVKLMAVISVEEIVSTLVPGTLEIHKLWKRIEARIHGSKARTNGVLWKYPSTDSSALIKGEEGLSMVYKQARDAKLDNLELTVHYPDQSSVSSTTIATARNDVMEQKATRDDNQSHSALVVTPNNIISISSESSSDSSSSSEDSDDDDGGMEDLILHANKIKQRGEEARLKRELEDRESKRIQASKRTDLATNSGASKPSTKRPTHSTATSSTPIPISMTNTNKAKTKICLGDTRSPIQERGVSTTSAKAVIPLAPKNQAVEDPQTFLQNVKNSKQKNPKGQKNQDVEEVDDPNFVEARGKATHKHSDKASRILKTDKTTSQQSTDSVSTLNIKAAESLVQTLSPSKDQRSIRAENSRLKGHDHPRGPSVPHQALVQDESQHPHSFGLRDTYIPFYDDSFRGPPRGPKRARYDSNHSSSNSHGTYDYRVKDTYFEPYTTLDRQWQGGNHSKTYSAALRVDHTGQESSGSTQQSTSSGNMHPQRLAAIQRNGSPMAIDEQIRKAPKTAKSTSIAQGSKQHGVQQSFRAGTQNNSKFKNGTAKNTRNAAQPQQHADKQEPAQCIKSVIPTRPKNLPPQKVRKPANSNSQLSGYDADHDPRSTFYQSQP